MAQTQEEKISLVNGRIHTFSGIAANITFEHGRIVSIDDEMSGIGGKIIDLQGRTVLPGFCDTGINFLAWSENSERLNLSSTHSVKELSEALSIYSQANSKPLRGWYIAYGLPEEITISRDDLDSVISDMPCAVIASANSHAVLNTAAMNEFNMPQDNVEFDEFSQHLPNLSEDDVIYLVNTYAPKVNALGISEIWADFYGNEKNLWDIFSCSAYDLLTFRLRCNFGFNEVNSLNSFLASGLRTGDGLPFCKFGGILVKGNLEQQEQKNMIYSAHLSGCQIISDNNKSCINALERVIKRSRKNSRHIIRGITESIIDRMRILGLGGIISPAQENNFLHETFQNGLVISVGSNENLAAPMNIIGRLVSDGLSISEALSLYTWSASWNGGNETRRGELSVGNDADMIVLEQDPFLVKPEEISAIDITMTFSAGCAVYGSGAI